MSDFNLTTSRPAVLTTSTRPNLDILSNSFERALISKLNTFPMLPFSVRRVLILISLVGTISVDSSASLERVFLKFSLLSKSTITAYRNQDYEKLEIYVGNFAEMNFTKKFDYITMIGVLEYANMFLPNSRNAFVDMICRCKDLLKDDGKLFIAIENRLGMKYWAGAAEDHTGICFDGIENYPKTDRVRTFSKSELEQIVVSAGMSKIEWFYPYPDYKLPMQIFSDAFLPTPELLSGDVSAYDSDRIQLFNERKALQSMAGTEEFKIFSNSFLLVVGK